MAGGLFNRVTTWIALQTLGYSAQNAEFDNIVAHMMPQYIDDYSASVSQMQELLSPGGVGTEAKATSAAEELRQLRYMIKAVVGGAQWYSSPPVTLTELNSLVGSLPGHRLISGRVDANSQPMFLVPNGASAAVTLKATSTNLVAQMAGTQRTFTADIALSGLSLAPAANNTCLVNDATLAGSAGTFYQGEGDTVITIDTIGAEISALNGKIAAFKIVNGANTEYFLARIDTTNNRLLRARRGFFFNSSDASIPRVGIADNNVITLMKLTWVFGTYDGSSFGADVTYTQPVVGVTAPSSPAIGDYWFDLAASTWKRYSGVAWVTMTAIPAGFCFQSSAATLGARSFDFFHAATGKLTLDLDYVDASTLRAKYPQGQVEVYGTPINFDLDYPTWSTATDIDSGSSDGASVNWFCYLTPAGARKLSNVGPYDRTADLLGWYHPSKPWRAVASLDNTSGSDFDSATLSMYFPPKILSRIVRLGSAGPNLKGLSNALSVDGVICPDDDAETVAYLAAAPTGMTEGKTLSVGVRGGSVKHPLVTSYKGGSHALMLWFGGVDTAGTIQFGYGFSCVRTATGKYTVTLTDGYGGTFGIPIVCPQGAGTNYSANIQSYGSGGFTVWFVDKTDTLTNVGFTFVMGCERG